jgi:hypothetical protein
MARLLVPLVEVTAPDGAKSFWAAYSMQHKEAVAAVKDRIPADHSAELSVRRLPPKWKFFGARPGDVIMLDLDTKGGAGTIKSAKRAKSARSASRHRRSRAPANEVDEMAAQMLTVVRNMRPGGRRLREIGRLRKRLHSLLRSTTNTRV